MSQQRGPRTSQGKSTVAYIRGAMFSLLSDPADRQLAERCMEEIERRVTRTEEAAVLAAIGADVDAYPERLPR